MIVYLKKSNRIVSAGALLAFVAIVIVVVNFLVLNDASMKLLPETVISDRRFLPDLSMKRLSRRLSQEKEPPQDKKVPSSDKNVPSSDTKVPSSDIKIPSSDTKVPPSDTKEPSSDSKVPPSDTKVPSSYKKDPPQDISVPFCTWKDSNTTIGDNLVNQTTEARHFHNFSQVFEELQYLPLCPQHSPLLRGRTEVYQGNITWEQAQVNKTVLHHGGYHIPPSCQARSRVAILVPYRDREEHLILFLNHIHPILMRQQIMYGIYVIEQAGDMKFNRALLFNAGYVEALKDFPHWDCFIFHDVDHMPEDDRNLYQCAEGPRLMAVAVDKWNYTHKYASFFGAVTAISRDQFELLNGFSNQFWGWGGEDDDMYERIKHAELNVTRCSRDIDRYTTLKHHDEEKSKDRFKVLKEGHQYYERDGLNNIEYNLLGVKREKIYTNITVDAYQIEPWPKKG